MADLQTDGAELAMTDQKCLPKIIKEPLIAPQELNTMWALDFMYYTLYTAGPLGS